MPTLPLLLTVKLKYTWYWYWQVTVLSETLLFITMTYPLKRGICILHFDSWTKYLVLFWRWWFSDTTDEQRCHFTLRPLLLWTQFSWQQVRRISILILTVDTLPSIRTQIFGFPMRLNINGNWVFPKCFLGIRWIQWRKCLSI